MLRYARRSVALLQRVHLRNAHSFLSDTKYKRTHVCFTKQPLSFCKKNYSSHIQWEIPKNEGPTVISSTRAPFFACGNPQAGEEDQFIAALYDGESSKIAEGLVTYGLDTRDYYGNTLLHLAAASDNNVDTINLLLSLGLDVNATNHQGLTPLFVAAFRGQIKVINLLIEQGAKTNVVDESDHTPLHYASWMGTAEAITLLVTKYNFLVNAKSKILRTPLHYAHSEEMANALIALGAKVEEKDNEGYTPLHTAARRGIRIVKILAKAGANINLLNNESLNPITLAAYYGTNQEVVRDLCENKANLNSPVGLIGTTPLQYAAMRGNLECVKILVEYGANIDAQSISTKDTALHYAVGNRHNDVVQFLVEKGANMELKNIAGNTSFFVAVAEGYADIVKIMAKGGANINGEESERPLIVAVLMGNLDVVVELVNLGANLEEKGLGGTTALIEAIFSGNLECAEILIKRGANVNVRNKDNCTPLHFASTPAAVELLANANAEMNPEIDSGFTPLHIAALGSNEELMTKLVEKGADVNAGSKGSPLSHAAINRCKNPKKSIQCLLRLGGKIGDALLSVRCVEALDALVDAGADVNEVHFTATPLFSAVLFKNEEVVRALVEKGANVNLGGTAGYSPLHAALLPHPSLSLSFAPPASFSDTVSPKDQKARKNIILFLLSKGADKNAINAKGSTPLHIACAYCDDTSFLHLLVPFLGLDVTNHKNQTPLMVAAEYGNKNAVQKLLELGAKVEYGYDNSPVQKAMEKGHKEIVELLENWSKKNSNSGK